jgi:glucosamine-6-phosphate deaminase
LKNHVYDQLGVSIADSADALGVEAAEAFALAARKALASQPEIAVLLATGNSQRTFRDAIEARDDIEWSRISILHVDEYLGVSGDSPASTGWRMNEDVAKRVGAKAFYPIMGDHEPVEEELARYTTLVRQLAPAICVMGVGENGHLAFNDPPADFDTREIMEVVTLDDGSKRQIVGEGRFPSVEEAPEQAITLTIHALLQPATVLVLVPEARKAEAIRATLEGPVSPKCPASILRQTPHAHMYLDPESSALLDSTRLATAGKD